MHTTMRSSQALASGRTSHLPSVSSKRAAVFRSALPNAAPSSAVNARLSEQAHEQLLQPQASRRSLIGSSLVLTAGVLMGAVVAKPAAAFTQAPPGFRLQVDKLDGYTFLYPESWLQVTSSGNDIFLRNPRNIDENLFVDMSSPSSSRYDSVTDLGSPEEAAKTIMDRYLTREFQSTRIGIRREGNVMSAVTRTGEDGRTYYDLTIRMTSYASRNPYASTGQEVMASYDVEWDRVLLTTLGVANKRLYELRFQSANDTFAASKPVAEKITGSFSVKEVDATPTVQLPTSLRAL